MPLPVETAAELEGIRMRLLEMLSPLNREKGDEGSQNLDEEVFRQALWSAVRALDPLLRDERAPVHLDLDQDGEAIRKILYDFVVWEYFTPRALEDAGDFFVPDYTPEECGFRVFFEHGRWFVTWLKLEEDSSKPEAMRRELLVCEKEENGNLFLSEV